MGQAVVSTAVLTCSFGVAPAPLTVVPASGVLAGQLPVATILDIVPITNIPSFGACTSLANPTVAAATTAAAGVLTPMPCVPVPLGPWVPGSPTVLVGGQPALASGSTCTCSYAGVITITVPGQLTTLVP